MFSVNTTRLTIIPLAAEQLDRFIEDKASFEAEFVSVYRGETLSPEFLTRLRARAAKLHRDPANWRWNTCWLIMRNEDRVVMGSFAFMDEPNDDGEVEIEYGLASEFWHCGYMTETVRAMCRWARHLPGVYSMIAKPAPDNIASKKVLINCGFIEDYNNFWVLEN